MVKIDKLSESQQLAVAATQNPFLGALIDRRAARVRSDVYGRIIDYSEETDPKLAARLNKRAGDYIKAEEEVEKLEKSGSN